MNEALKLKLVEVARAVEADHLALSKKRAAAKHSDETTDTLLLAFKARGLARKLINYAGYCDEIEAIIGASDISIEDKLIEYLLNTCGWVGNEEQSVVTEAIDIINWRTASVEEVMGDFRYTEEQAVAILAIINEESK